MGIRGRDSQFATLVGLFDNVARHRINRRKDTDELETSAEGQMRGGGGRERNRPSTRYQSQKKGNYDQNNQT